MIFLNPLLNGFTVDYVARNPQDETTDLSNVVVQPPLPFRVEARGSDLLESGAQWFRGGSYGTEPAV